MGAATTSIACVDDGLVIPDTRYCVSSIHEYLPTYLHTIRMILNMGGNDITEFLYVLLSRINFPYKEVDLSRSYDWNLMEDLKARLCTLTEVWICIVEVF